MGQTREDEVGVVALPATCGELVQGTLDSVPCLVSCPIARYGLARVRIHAGEGARMPTDAPKAVAALAAGLDALGCADTCTELHLSSDIPRGRGYGSSTVDIGASLYALGEALGLPFTAAEVAHLAVSVEPSDSTIFPGLVLFDHRTGSFHESLGQAPPLMILLLDPAVEVDTIAFNRVDRRAQLRRLAGEHERAFDLLRQGIAHGDTECIGAAVTLSAQAHQSILYNPLLEGVTQLARDVHALGVCRAHSGSLLGILLDPTQNDLPEIKNYARSRIGHQAQVAHYRLVDGGPYYQEQEEFANGKPIAGCY